MQRLLALTGALAMFILVAAPALAADPAVSTGERVLISINGDATIPAGEQAEAVIVVNGNALVLGTVDNVTVIGGTATLDGATIDTLTVIDGRATLLGTTRITGDIVQLESTIERAESVVVDGTTRSLAESMAGFALFLGMAAIVLWLGTALALLLAGLALAAFAARQVRSAEAIISREPLKAFVTGLLMVVLPPLVFIALAVTVIGLPLALSLLLFVWPALAFIGYLVAAIWLGEWILRTLGRREPAERPYLGATVGLLVGAVVGLVPLVTAIMSIFGLGAVSVAAWRTLIGRRPLATSLAPNPAPLGA